MLTEDFVMPMTYSYSAFHDPAVPRASLPSFNICFFRKEVHSYAPHFAALFLRTGF
ncbi:MAG: hypothetical protein QOJ76_1367, partial [Acidobacteriota bacterium]|nr:hypothetical protein [Acidobacteriota bacterium]